MEEVLGFIFITSCCICILALTAAIVKTAFYD